MRNARSNVAHGRFGLLRAQLLSLPVVASQTRLVGAFPCGRVGSGVEYEVPASSSAATARAENTGNRRAAANTITRATLTMDRLKALPELSDPCSIPAIPQICL
jgi:hypothetical protein